MNLLKSLKVKIILSSAASILIVGVFSNVYLYNYLTGIIREKVEEIDDINLQTIQTQLNRNLEGLVTLGTLCAYDQVVAAAMRNPMRDTLAQTRAMLNARDILQRFLDANSYVNPYVQRLIAFNTYGIWVQPYVRGWPGLEDPQLVMNSEVFQSILREDRRQIITVAPSIIDGQDCIVFLGRIYETPAMVQRGWLYIELNPVFINNLLPPYSHLFVVGENGVVFPREHGGLPPGFLPEMTSFTYNGRTFAIQSTPLAYGGLRLFQQTDITFLSPDANTILYTAVVTAVTSISAALILSVLLGGIITKPLKRLNYRLQRISENDFSHDPVIEMGEDEITDIGRMVNKMTKNILTLLHEMEGMHVQKKNFEIALLQSQINPHFLYNTLDSIRWMAVIQKNTGIEKTVRSLSALLRSMAKLSGDRITLEQEIELLRAYLEIHSVRFMNSLEFDDRIPVHLRNFAIVKLVLQPLVENAVFHGIEPSGESGKIIIDAKEAGDDLLIIVEDNGVGLSLEELRAILESKTSEKSMTGIGIANVDSRLKFIYGEGYGLSFESEPSLYTRVTVRIRKESIRVQDTAG